MKVLILDSSTIINLALNSSLDLLPILKKKFNISFIISKAVKYEVIDRPLQIKKYELEALRISKLVDDKVLEFPDILGIKDSEIISETSKILNLANSSFFAKEKAMHIVDSGEISCIAISKMCNTKKIENMIAADERTIRMLVENPENLRKFLESRLHTRVNYKENLSFNDLKFIRSSEILYIAYKKGLIDLKGPEVLDALLYATKFNGNAISSDEIEEMKKLSRI